MNFNGIYSIGWSFPFWGFSSFHPTPLSALADNFYFSGGFPLFVPSFGVPLFYSYPNLSSALTGFGPSAAMSPWDVGAYMAYHVYAGESGWLPPDWILARDFPSLVHGAPASKQAQDQKDQALAEAQKRDEALAEQNKALQADNQQMRATFAGKS